MNDSPLVGITPDIASDIESRQTRFALEPEYTAAVQRAGGLPVILAADPALCTAYLDRLDGLIVSGGMFDIDPARYGRECRLAHPVFNPERTDFEWRMVAGALARDLPLLGICNGMQLLGVVMGAALIQEISAEIPGALEHLQPRPYSAPAHPVTLTPASRLKELLGDGTLQVNSVHHQAVAAAPDGAVVGARAPDGVIEAMEVPEKRFCIGVQWHPEQLGQHALFAALVRHAEAYRRSRGESGAGIRSGAPE